MAQQHLPFPCTGNTGHQTDCAKATENATLERKSVNSAIESVLQMEGRWKRGKRR